MENMPLAINLTFVGLTVVFLALILLSLIIYLSTKLLSFNKKNASGGAASSSEANVLEIEDEDAGNSISSEPASTSTDDELIAVIMAAIQASMVPGSQCKLQVKSFRRIGQNSPVWNKAGRLEQITRVF